MDHSAFQMFGKEMVLFATVDDWALVKIESLLASPQAFDARVALSPNEHCFSTA